MTHTFTEEVIADILERIAREKATPLVCDEHWFQCNHPQPPKENDS